jgi:uncharacterized membrane protein YkgB
MTIFRWVEAPFADRGHPWWVPLAVGIGVILAGLAIMVMPWILVALAAGFVVSAGISLVTLAFEMRAADVRAREPRVRMYVHDPARPWRLWEW